MYGDSQRVVIADNGSRIPLAFVPDRGADRRGTSASIFSRLRVRVMPVTPRGAGEMAVWRHVARRLDARRILCIHDSCRILADVFRNQLPPMRHMGPLFIPVFTFDVANREHHAVADVDAFDDVWCGEGGPLSRAYADYAYIPVQGAMAYCDREALTILHDHGALHLDTSTRLIAPCHRRTRQTYERALGACVAQLCLLPGWVDECTPHRCREGERLVHVASRLTQLFPGRVSLCGRVDRLPGYFDRGFRVSESRSLRNRSPPLTIVKEWAGR